MHLIDIISFQLFLACLYVLLKHIAILFQYYTEFTLSIIYQPELYLELKEYYNFPL